MQSHREISEGPDGHPIVFVDASALLHVTPYVLFTTTLRIVQIEIPPNVSLEEIVERGGARWLDTLPARQTILEERVSSKDAYAQWAQTLSTSP